jgi:hypothetical protein
MSQPLPIVDHNFVFGKSSFLGTKKWLPESSPIKFNIRDSVRVMVRVVLRIRVEANLLV